MGTLSGPFNRARGQGLAIGPGLLPKEIEEVAGLDLSSMCHVQVLKLVRLFRRSATGTIKIKNTPAKKTYQREEGILQ